MKRILMILCLVMFGGMAMAQNVIGKPIYYSDSTQYRPGHGMDYDNPPMMFDSHNSKRYYKTCNTFFLESSMMFGAYDAAMGVNFSVVPAKWGIYGSALWGYNYDWVKAGGIFRITNLKSPVDWQVYGGLVFGPGVGADLGFRFSIDNIFGNHNFSWWSATMGVSIVGGSAFMTCGFSIALSGFSLFGFLL